MNTDVNVGNIDRFMDRHPKSRLYIEYCKDMVTGYKPMVIRMEYVGLDGRLMYFSSMAPELHMALRYMNDKIDIDAENQIPKVPLLPESK